MSKQFKQKITGILVIENFLKEVEQVLETAAEHYGIELVVEGDRLLSAHSRTIYELNHYLLRAEAGGIPIESFFYTVIGRLCFEIASHHVVSKLELNDDFDGSGDPQFTRFRHLYTQNPNIMLALHLCLDWSEDLISRAIGSPLRSTVSATNVDRLQTIVRVIDANEFEAYRVLDLAELDWAFRRRPG